MTPSLTMSRPDSLTSNLERDVVTFPSLTYGAGPSSGARSRRALIMSAHRQLRALAARQGASSEFPYARVLRLIGSITIDGAPTPQVGSNGEGGILVEWLVNGWFLALDYEDETEILLSASTPDGFRFAETITAWWEQHDAAVTSARRFLAEMAAGVAHPVPLV